ncbi:MAG: putative integral rane protein [Chloroflexota bacterium]|jgi:hypothetical protein|nr:putative integral rane protein [Chloroflexota bacterium]
MNWTLFWLFLHISAAIVAFGPTFVFPIIGPMIGKEPQHAHFAVVIMEKIEKGLVVPVALTMLVSGIGLIVSSHINPTGSVWLGVAIVIYLVEISLAIFVQLPTTARLAKLTEQGPPPGAPTGGGPPPAIAALARRSQMVGILMTVGLFTIIFLMIVKPGGTTTF